MSTTLLLANMREGVPPDEVNVRSNTYVVGDSPPAAQDGPPEFEEVTVDNNPDLGMVNRQKASFWSERQRYTPEWVDAAGAPHNDLINRHVASDGLAASREARGDWGHGTMSAAIGIEPVQDLQGAGGYGADTFVVEKKGAQESAGQFMSPSMGEDPAYMQAVNAESKDAAREASNNAYRLFYSNAVGE